MDVPPTTPPPYTLLTASGPTFPGSEAPKAAGGSGSQQPQVTSDPCPCPCHVDTPYPHHLLARLRGEQVIQQAQGQRSQAQTQRELAPQAHNQQLREQAQQPQDVYQTPLAQGLSEDRGHPPAGAPSAAPTAGATTIIAATGAAGATTTTAGAATTNTGAPATNSSSSSSSATAVPDSSGAASTGVVGSGTKGSEGVAGVGGFVRPEASPAHTSQGSQQPPPQHNTMQDSIQVGSGAGALAGTGGGTKATEGFGSPMLSPGSPAEKAPPNAPAPAAPAPAATAHAHPATDALTTNTTTSVTPSPLGTASASSGQQLLPALAVSPYLLAASVQGGWPTGGIGGSGMQQPASTTLPVASLPSELKLVVEGAIRLYTSTSHRQAQAIVSALYSRSAWYDGPVLLAAGRSSLVGLAGVLRALCARVEVQARPVTVTEPVACGVTSVGEITSSQPAVSGVIASAANTAVSKGAPQLPPAVLTLTIPTVQRWHLRPWPARAARLLGLPTTWRLHITTILTLNAATDRVVAHQDVLTDTSTFLPLPSWLRPAVGLPVAVGAALLGL